jgi:hypothetical protein
MLGINEIHGNNEKSRNKEQRQKLAVVTSYSPSLLRKGTKQLPTFRGGITFAGWENTRRIPDHGTGPS